MVEISTKWLKHCTEIPVLLLFFSFMVCETVNTNFIIYRTCYVSLGYNRSDCEKLGAKNPDNETQDLEKIVQPHANIIMMTQSLVAQIVPALLCLFVGPWSDKHGRKPLLISTLFGYTVSSVLQIVVALIPSLSPWYLLGVSFTSILFGGFSPFLMAVLCYITDITTETGRAFRIGMFETTLVSGMLMGTLSSSYIFTYGGYIMVYSIGCLCCLLALLYVIFVITESVLNTSDYQNDTSLFTFDHIADMLKTTFTPRENYKRCVLLLTISMATIYILATNSDASVFFLYVREKFGWNIEQYTLYKAFKDVLWIVGIFIGMSMLHKLCGLGESPLLFLGFASYLASVLLQAFASIPWQLYLAGGIRCISGVVSPMCRSLISKLVPKEESGKIFSITITVESLTGLVGAPLYTFMYNYTLDINPGAFNFLTSGFFVVEITLIAIVMVIQNTVMRHQPPYTALSVNPDATEGD